MTRITDIRFGPIDDAGRGHILFDCGGVTYSIPEPPDVLLVGVEGEAPARWILERYGYLIR